MAKVFESQQAAYEGLLSQAISEGYSIALYKRYPTLSSGLETTRVVYRCARGGPIITKELKEARTQATHPQKRRKNTRSACTHCPFKICTKKTPSGGWVIEAIQLRGQDVDHSHNHPMDFNATSHHAYRRYKINVWKSQILAYWRIGDTPGTIMAKVREQLGGKKPPFLVSDVKNLCRAHGEASLRGDS
ncbi:hypothetical protein PspLS_09598 [Pyricularia sp. CBS 133598]|nr:hypothetical protein PspLS_09598 [Pyricularia sp. CBS 133598]